MLYELSGWLAISRLLSLPPAARSSFPKVGDFGAFNWMHLIKSNTETNSRSWPLEECRCLTRSGEPNNRLLAGTMLGVGRLSGVTDGCTTRRHSSIHATERRKHTVNRDP
uniref:Secreted protein n=1 Tax=Ascaris lumbricoides TaxID=6252 RepID=A0A0M3HWI3_ASCLU